MFTEYTWKLLMSQNLRRFNAYSQHVVRLLHVSVFSLHEDAHDHADVCTAHGTAVERSHSLFAQLS